MSLLRQWDRLGIYVLLMAFGAYSTIYPIVSLEKSSPYWVSILLGLEFFFAGLMLTVGMNKRPRMRVVGLLVVCIGLTTISLVIATYGGTRVLAYAFLFGAFAMQSVYDIRQERSERQKWKDAGEQLVVEITRLVEETEQGDRS